VIKRSSFAGKEGNCGLGDPGSKGGKKKAKTAGVILLGASYGVPGNESSTTILIGQKKQKQLLSESGLKHMGGMGIASKDFEGWRGAR